MVVAPTPRAIALAAIGAPIALVAGLVRPEYWFVAVLWLALVLALIALDAVIAAPLGRVPVSLATPQAAGVGDGFRLGLAVAGSGARQPAVALSVDSLLAANGRIDAPLVADDGQLVADIPAVGARRGIAHILLGWIGWRGPLGLARRQRRIALDRDIAIVPSIRAAQEEGASLFARDAMIGQRLQARLGEGSEFESLVRFMPGLDRRAIDWKQSARHTDLLAKQFETERDNRIVLMIDSGRLMSDPLGDVAVTDAAEEGESRLDRAISSALALAYVALRLEDRVSLSSFAARPRIDRREYARLSDFAALRRTAASIDYAPEESNFTLGLATLAASLKRRAMVVVFTDFADANGAQLMMRAVERLVTKHLLVFVTFADSELEATARRLPEKPEHVAAATIAADLLRDRRLVLTRLRRMGALVVEAPADAMPAALLDTYIRIKRKGMI